jgi:hypothetical protein
MNSYMLSLLALIITALVFCYIKLGFTNKVKVSIIGSSFVFAFLGLLSKSFFEVWQLVLFLLLCSILFTLFISKRFGSEFLLNREGNGSGNEAVLEINNGKSEILAKGTIQSNEIIDKFDSPNITIENSVSEEMPNLSINIENEDEMLLNNTVLMDEEESVNFLFEEQYKQQKVVNDNDEMYLDITPIDDEKLERSSTVNIAIVETDKSERIEIDQNIDMSESDNYYLAELEQLILEEEIVKTDKEDGTSNSSFMSVREQEILEGDKDIILTLEHIDPVTVYEEIAATIEEDIGEETSFNKSEQTSNTTNEILTHEGKDLVISEENNSDRENLLVSGIETDDLHRQLFITMVSQIQLARKLIDSNKYEQMLKEYLHPDLPVSEYYTIASLLIQHYISEKEPIKLIALLDKTEEKVTKHPVLLQEIQYYKSLF